MSSQIFTGRKSGQQYFGWYLKEFESDQLKPGNKKRRRIHKYEEVDKKLIKYMQIRKMWRHLEPHAIKVPPICGRTYCSRNLQILHCLQYLHYVVAQV